MAWLRTTDPFPPEAWGLTVDEADRLCMHGVPLSSLAREHGTPLHVLDLERLRATAARMREELAAALPGAARLHYAMKANNTPEVAAVMRDASLGAEVMTEYELWLALCTGFEGRDIIVNGPCKSPRFIAAAIEAGVRAISVDSIDELQRIAAAACERGCAAPVLLRINPDYVPRHMNTGSATASRSGSPFGLDLAGGEADAALMRCVANPGIRFLGFHMHIGTGLRHADEHVRALARLHPLLARARALGMRVRVLDLGGGFGVATTRQYTAWEMLLYEALGMLPRHTVRQQSPATAECFARIAAAVRSAFAADEMPELLLEPGRSLVSSAQLLLLGVAYRKHRAGAGTWLITDGGLGTVTMPTYYEHHEVFACDGAHRARTERVHITGPGCFTGDIVYRNKPMPPLAAGDVIAVMDSGAYFLALESNFGHPHPEIVGVDAKGVRVLRRREEFADMLRCSAAAVECAQVPGAEHPSPSFPQAAGRSPDAQSGIVDGRGQPSPPVPLSQRERGWLRS